VKLLLISRCPPYPLHLGDRLIPYHLARLLSQRGDEIDLLAYFDDAADQRQIGHYAHYFRAVHLIREPERSLRSYLARLVVPGAFFPRKASASWSPEMWDRIRNMLASTRYDAVQLFGGVHVYEFRTLVQHLPNVIVPYESYSLYLRRAAQQQQLGEQGVPLSLHLQSWAARQYEQRMFKGFKRVVVLSTVDAEQLLRLNSRLPLKVIPNGVDLNHFKPQPPAESAHTKSILFFGNFDYVPNADAARWLVREIFPLISAQAAGVKLTLVGNNPPPDLRLLEAENVQIVGRVPDLRPYLADASVFISPLRMGAGIKNKMLEAMAMGKAIVATPLSADGIDVLPDENVLLGNTAAELAAQTVRLLNDSSLRADMETANRALVEEQYSWERVADEYEKLYREVLNA
jgi:glycosyltransferase involved in cell wall biosynthesis